MAAPRSEITCWCQLFFFIVIFQTMSVVSVSAGNNPHDPRPEVRIAVIATSPWNYIDEILIPFMVHKFNNATDRTLLPDYDVKVDLYSHELGTGTADVELVRILSDDTPAYHAVRGPSTDPTDVQDVAPMAAQARILFAEATPSEFVGPKAVSPYSFHLTPSSRGEIMAMFYLVASNGWRSMASVWASAENFDMAIVAASTYNVSNYETLAEAGEPQWATVAWQRNLVRIIRFTRTRVIGMYLNVVQMGYQSICRVHREKISGIQYLLWSGFPPAWYLQSYAPSLGDCSGEEMMAAVQGGLYVTLMTIAAGVQFPGLWKAPVSDHDDSQEFFPCMPGYTVNDVFNSPELRQFAIDQRPDQAIDVVFLFTLMGINLADSVCALIHGLHDGIYNKNISLSSIEKRDESAFATLVESMSQIDYYGLTGRVVMSDGRKRDFNVRVMMDQDPLPGLPPGSTRFAVLPPIFFAFPGGLYEPPEPILRSEDALVWRDGSTGLGPKPDLGVFPDCGLVNGLLVWDSCEPCPQGFGYDPDLQECQVCPPGQFQNETGKRTCKTTSPGWFIVNASNHSEAAPCPLGHECPQVGTVMPQPCLEGRFAAASGQSACDLCPSGQYGNTRGASGCISCSSVLAGGVTANVASESVSDCICPLGTFRAESAHHCSPCPEGMSCPEGSDMSHLLAWLVPSADAAQGSESLPSLPYPRVNRGYMTKVSEPLVVYKCGEDGHCPGGLPGTCAARRDPTTVACGDCMSGSFEAGEECRECKGQDFLPMFFAALGIAVALTAVILAINSNIQNTPSSSLLIVVLAGLLATSLQTMGVFHAADVPWEEPAKSLLGLAALLTFDLHLLKGSCVTGVSPVRSFGIRQLLAPLLIPFTAVILLLRKYAISRSSTRRKSSKNVSLLAELCNSVGTLWSFLFISTVMSATDPLLCYVHPGGAGESVVSAPSLLCFEGGDHTSMVLIGMCALCLVPLPFLCICVHIVMQYPIYMRLNTGGRNFFHASRFLFMRYAPSRYYFHLFGLLRSLLICAIPAIIRAKPAAQMLSAGVVLSAYVLIVDYLRPWRNILCNFTDTALTLGLLLLVLCGSIFLEGTPDAEKQAIGILLMIALMSMISGTVMGICYGLWLRLLPTCFQFFICHHKKDAAAQARFLKVQLLKHGVARVFIDSDNLEQLDTLFDIVKSRVKHLVVLLTADTLKRPWCVGEIVTALRARIEITRLRTSSFVAPNYDDIESPETFVDCSSCNLREYSINGADITGSLSTFLSSTVELKLNEDLPGTWRFSDAASCLAKHRPLDQKAIPALAGRTSIPAHGIVVITDVDNTEASCAAGILVDRIGPEVYRVCAHGIHLLCDYMCNMDMALEAARQASARVVILSEACLQSLIMLTIISELSRMGVSVISLNIPGFVFPSPELIAKLVEKHLSQAAAEHVNAFFKNISILLSTHAAQEVLNAQSDEVCRRIKQIVSWSSSSVLRISSSTPINPGQVEIPEKDASTSVFPGKTGKSSRYSWDITV